MERKNVITAAACVAAILATCGILTAFSGSGTEHETEYVTKGGISGTVEESGNIEGEKDYTYFANVSAPVSMVDIKVGDYIKKDRLLLLYDTDDLQRSVKQAELASLQSRQNADGQIERSDKYQSKYNKAVADDAAYAGLYWYERESKDGLSEGQYTENYYIQCQVDGIEKDIADKQKELVEKTDYYNSLADKTTKEAKDVYNRMCELDSQIAGLNKDLAAAPPMTMTPEENAQANDTANVMEDITRNWTQAKTEKNTYEAGILTENQKEALNTQADIALEKEDQIKNELEKAKAGVKAEFDGVVTECDTKEGNVVTKGTPLFKVVGSDDLKVTLMISKYDIGYIKEGQRAQIDVAGQKLEGKVTRINHVATSDDSDKNKVAVDVHIDGESENLILGLEADVTIYTDEKQDVLLIPYAGYYSDDDGDYCYLVNSEGRIEKRYFTAGIKTDDFVEVREGLKENEMVIVDSVTDDQVGKKAK